MSTLLLKGIWLQGCGRPNGSQSARLRHLTSYSPVTKSPYWAELTFVHLCGVQVLQCCGGSLWGYFAGSILSFLGFEDPTYYDFDILGRVWRTYSHRVVMCDFQHVYIHLSSPRGSIIVNKCHKWPWHERVLSRTFVVSEIVKTYEILVYEHVVFFAILSSIQGLLFGYMWSNLAMFLSFFLSWGLKTQPNHWTKRTVNTQLRI